MSWYQILAKIDEDILIVKAPLSKFREQDKNARAMSKEAFHQLTENIKKEKRLESLPFGVLKDDFIEIISGHHRTRAARVAGLEEIPALVDIRNLPMSKIKAKQLAHNSITGTDDPKLLKQIFEEIENLDDMMEAFVNPDLLGIGQNVVNYKISNLDIDYTFKSVNMLFLGNEFGQFEKVLEILQGGGKNKKGPDATYVVCGLEMWAKFSEVLGKVQEKFNVRSVSTQISKMCEIVLENLEANEVDQESSNRQDATPSA